MPGQKPGIAFFARRRVTHAPAAKLQLRRYRVSRYVLAPCRVTSTTRSSSGDVAIARLSSLGPGRSTATAGRWKACLKLAPCWLVGRSAKGLICFAARQGRSTRRRAPMASPHRTQRISRAISCDLAEAQVLAKGGRRYFQSRDTTSSSGLHGFGDIRKPKRFHSAMRAP
jgi:hypothetical protein